jgi:Tfp pilus assembly pilus retraction ATPase PilT
MQTLERSLANLVQDNKITAEEAMLKTIRPEELTRLLEQV